MFDYQDYGAFKGARAAPPRSAAKRLARKLGLRHRYLRFLDDAPRNEPLLEIGCGDGSFLAELMEAGFQKVLGIEPSSSYETVVDDRLVIRGWAHEYLAGAPAGSIATVVALDVFEHIPHADLKALLMKLGECVAPGGRVLLRVPNMTSALALHNYFGDVSHTTGLNEMSLRQLAHGSAFTDLRFYAEPFAYPTSLMALLGVILWLPYRVFAGSLMAAYGVRARILTPNLVCVLHKQRKAS